MNYTIETKEPKKVLLKDMHNGSIFRIITLDNDLYMKLDRVQFDKTLKDWDIESYFDDSGFIPVINLSNGKLLTMDFLDYVYPVEHYEFKVSI